MKIKYTIAPALLAVFSTQVMAADCSVTVDSTDAMKYDKNEIVVDKSCKQFTIKLTHSGKQPKNVMGHNIVIAKSSDVDAVARDGWSSGADNGFLKPGDDRIIVHTDLIGGGEETSTTFDVAKLKGEESYSFFCSFPGHITLMKGTVTLK